MIITYDTLIRQVGGVVDMRSICIGELSGIKIKKEKHDTRAETYQPSRKLTPIRPSSLKQPYPLDPATSVTPHPTQHTCIEPPLSAPADRSAATQPQRATQRQRLQAARLQVHNKPSPTSKYEQKVSSNQCLLLD